MTNSIELQKNIRPFTAVIGNNGFGRIVIYTDADSITRNNILEELASALSAHHENMNAISYLDRYYRGDQPILYRKKDVRPDINNRTVENHALEIVDSKVADLYGEPVQYVLADAEDEKKAEQMKTLNRYMKSEDKAALDIERGRWASICGTSYFYIGRENRMPKDFDEAPFYISVENPLNTFVVYYSDDHTPAFSCQIRNSKQGAVYNIYTDREYYMIRAGEIIDVKSNGNGMIPVIEYPNNERRLSDIEITITMTDELNKMQSDRMNGIEQFIQAFMLFKNCKIDAKTFKELAFNGALSVADSAEGRTADVKMMTAELSQDGTQVSKDDVYNSLLIVQGMPGRQENSGGDTGQAVALRNGYYAEDKRAELRIPIFQRSERMMLRLVLNRLRIKNNFTLMISDIDIRPKRSKLENMLVKAEVLQILHNIGIDDAIAIKTINLFADVQDTVMKSKERMAEQFKSANGMNEAEVVNSNGDTTEA